MPNYNSTLQTNNSSLEEIITQLNNMPDAGGADPVLQDKTVTPTISTQTITADNGYDGLDTVTVNAMPTATQATPSVSINSSTGLITATATQSAGYVAAGTKSATSQLAFKAATTITPGTANQTAVSANTYVGGDITVKGDANLVASNIVSGKSIFGVVGTATTGGGGGDTSVEDNLIKRTISGTYTNDRIYTIGEYAFYKCSNLTTVNFPICTSISSSAFMHCNNLTTVSFPACTRIEASAFAYCYDLTTVSFPACTNIGTSAFCSCASLTTANFPKCTYINNSAFFSCKKLATISFPLCSKIGPYAFARCSSLAAVSFPVCTNIGSSAFLSCTNLSTIYLGASTVCSMGQDVFYSTGITSQKGSIFVPASLVETYKTATRWSAFSSRIFSYNFT